MNEVLALEEVRKNYGKAQNTISVLKGVSITIHAGELIALLGPSGTGKSTLLHIAGLLDHPDTGTVRLLGKACTHASDLKRTQIRRLQIGFVYQFHHLMPELTALENVILPQRLAGKSLEEAACHARELLDRLGLARRLVHSPSALSGGEQQRVAVARALANAPALLLADEPTGNLDEKTADNLVHDLIQLARTTQMSALIATHNPAFANRLDKCVRLKDGILYNT
ncbi:MAG: ABC transporter ATP-binding protein [Holosporales bacterium]|jgi:lipoprotein-releasing system ATP-binding protein|nr:ABC transporter ATP-binding protein [Holosporales bacterium]